MKKVVIIAALLISVVFYAQEVKPKFEVEGNEVKATYFYDNGQIKQEGHYLEGKLQGKWVAYSEDGNKTAVGEYIKGEKVGKWFFWTENSLNEVDYSDNRVADVRKWSREVMAKN
ncbi:membrane-binding protein [uncultured Flavobacterium sp.]|uniref:toxin-antitoxin system YwqK family antitoxin n=1 Tax=uncultured Flavobacterium sp. TaxID=165435 RepID=UPI0030CA3A9D